MSKGTKYIYAGLCFAWGLIIIAALFTGPGGMERAAVAIVISSGFMAMAAWLVKPDD